MFFQNNRLSNVKNGRHEMCLPFIYHLGIGGILCNLDEIENITILILQDVYQYVQE